MSNAAAPANAVFYRRLENSRRPRRPRGPPAFARLGDRRPPRVHVQPRSPSGISSLLKTLQQKLTCVAVPWLPPPTLSRRACERDRAGRGDRRSRTRKFMSHYDLYLQAMLGAPTPAPYGVRRARARGKPGDVLGTLTIPAATKSPSSARSSRAAPTLRSRRRFCWEEKTWCRRCSDDSGETEGIGDGVPQFPPVPRPARASRRGNARADGEAASRDAVRRGRGEVGVGDDARVDRAARAEDALGRVLEAVGNPSASSAQVRRARCAIRYTPRASARSRGNDAAASRSRRRMGGCRLGLRSRRGRGGEQVLFARSPVRKPQRVGPGAARFLPRYFLSSQSRRPRGRGGFPDRCGSGRT